MESVPEPIGREGSVGIIKKPVRTDKGDRCRARKATFGATHGSLQF